MALHYLRSMARLLRQSQYTSHLVLARLPIRMLSYFARTGGSALRRFLPGHRPTSTSAVAHQANPSRRLIQTLDQRRLEASDWIDISLRLQPTIRVQLSTSTEPSTEGTGAYCLCSSTGQLTNNAGARLVYHRIGIPKGFPLLFPANTHGFLYHHKGPDAPTDAGEVRFRVTPAADPTSFSAGHDLLGPHDLPWAVPVLSLERKRKYTALRTLLVRDGTVNPGFWDAYPDMRLDASSTVLHSCGQPFYYDWSWQTFSLWIAGRNATRIVQLTSLLKEDRGGIRRWPYVGE